MSVCLRCDFCKKIIKLNESREEESVTLTICKNFELIAIATRTLKGENRYPTSRIILFRLVD